MGIFKNDKKVCPICCSPTPRLLATKIEGVPICSDCDKKIDMSNDRKKNLTLNELEEYMVFYEENQPLKDEFTVTYERHCGFMKSKAFYTDELHQTFKLSNQDEATVYTPDDFVSLTIALDDVEVMKLTKDRLVIHKSDVPAFIKAQDSAVNAYVSGRQIAEAVIRANQEMKRDERRHDIRDEGRHPNGTNGPSHGPNNPPHELDHAHDAVKDFEVKYPYRKWNIDIVIDHPWGEGIHDDNAFSLYDREHPSTMEAYERFDDSLEYYKELLLAFREAICPNAEIIDETACVASVGNTTTIITSAADEIKKFAELKEQGIITEEEFAAKKKQLLGL